VAEPDVATGATRFAFLVKAIAGVIARRTFILHTSSRPAIFPEWFVIAATVIAIRRRQWGLVLQVAVLMLTDWSVDTLSMGRGLKQEYFNLTDPLAIIAAALLISKLVDLQYHRWTYRLGIALIGVHLVISQAEPLKNGVLKKQGPEKLCELYHYAKRVEHFPFCPPPPAPR
jgi:hypothetical protein